MTDTQHMQMTGYLTTETAHTPMRGHRHKRSFAISGDFDFLKQPVSLPPLPNNASAASETPMDAPNGPEEPPEIVIEHNLASPEVAAEPALSPRVDENPPMSPRFFISEEPRFSSPFRGVPDAIINLDDALKTKPKCFKSHKRSESAPADLAVLLSAKSVSRPSQMIEEEEDDDEVDDEEECNPLTDFRISDGPEVGIKSSLLSPLRPMSPSPAVHLQDLTLDGSPVRLNRENRNDNYNSLKINRQKQRYYQYTKKLPITGSSIQPQTLSEKVSSTSLSSACLKTPLSSFQTPSRHASTPSTPISVGSSQNNNNFDNSSRLTSPFRSQQMHSNMRNTTSSSFRYESKVYDMPHGRMNSDSVSSRDDKTLYRKDTPFLDGCDVTDEDQSGSESNGEEKDRLPISRELLFGQPGDTVDLSSLSSPIKETFLDYKSSSNEDVMSPVRHNTHDDSERLSSADDTPESRSVSDTLLVMNKTRKEKRKVKSKLNVLFMNLFRYSNNYEQGAKKA